MPYEKMLLSVGHLVSDAFRSMFCLSRKLDDHNERKCSRQVGRNRYSFPNDLIFRADGGTLFWFLVCIYCNYNCNFFSDIRL